jgi:hypothetical protein
MGLKRSRLSMEVRSYLIMKMKGMTKMRVRKITLMLRTTKK